MKIFVDFDNVIYKCDKRLSEIIGEPLKHFDLVEHGITKEVFSCEDFYINSIEYKVEGVFDALKLLDGAGELKILTKYVNPSEHKFKRSFMDWLGFKHIEIIFVPIDGDKQSYLEDGDYIIDDDVRNLDENHRNILFDYNGTFSYEWNKHETKEFVEMTNWDDIVFYVLLDMLSERAKLNPSMDEMLEM